MKRLPLDKIEFDVDTQMRDVIDGDTVNDYRDAMKAGAEFPPLIVFFDGATYWLADGYHRCHAASEAGIESMQCDVRKGTKRDAILYACGANSSNGLRRTNLDKHKAVTTLLKDDEWSKWSNVVIADKCGVSHTFVANLRSQHATVAGFPSRRGADGKARKAPKRKKVDATKLPEDAKPLAPKHAIDTPKDTLQDDENQLDTHGSTGPVKSTFTVPEPDRDVLNEFIPFWNGLTAKQRRTIKIWIREQEDE